MYSFDQTESRVEAGEGSRVDGGFQGELSGMGSTEGEPGTNVEGESSNEALAACDRVMGGARAAPCGYRPRGNYCD
jgi:hypothetical protein